MPYQKTRNGFTLIELIVIIVVIGLLVAIVASAFSSAQVRTRDTQRKHDLKQIQVSLETYRQDKGTYPQISGAVCMTSTNIDSVSPAFTPTYMTQIPLDPKNGTDCPCYLYSVSDSFLAYSLFANLETTTDQDATAIKPVPATNSTFTVTPTEPASQVTISTSPACQLSTYNYWVSSP